MIVTCYHVKSLCPTVLVDFLHTLDEQYVAKTSNEGSAMAKKKRRIGSLSTLSMPAEAPNWTKVSSVQTNQFTVSVFKLQVIQDL